MKSVVVRYKSGLSVGKYELIDFRVCGLYGAWKDNLEPDTLLEEPKLKDNLQKYYARWKKELKKSSRRMSRWSALCRFSVIRPLSEHRLACEIVFLLTVIRKLQDDFRNTKEWILNYYDTPQLRDEDLLSLEIEHDADNKKMSVLKYKFIGEKSFILHRAIACNYNSENCEEVHVNAREICNQVIHSYIWTFAYSDGRLLGVAISSDIMIEKCMYIVKITDLIGYIEYCRDTFLPTAQRLSIIEHKSMLYEILSEGKPNS